MKIKRLVVNGLNNSSEEFNLSFHQDLNILTGKNGSGKTTMLKLLWYILSGNINLIINEVVFNSIRLETDEYIFYIEKDSQGKCRISLDNNIGESICKIEELINPHDFMNNDYRNLSRELQRKGRSLFFPTFRRIEGGFNIEGNKRRTVSGSLEDTLLNISNELSRDNHVFIVSLSTLDIENLLTRKYSELSEEYSKVHQDISAEIIDDIKSKGDRYYTNDDLKEFIEIIKDKIETMENDRRNIMYPFDVLKRLVIKLFNHSGIKLDDNRDILSFGDTTKAMKSNLLSAGEKQMLSFISYNTFYHDTIFIIDEPELSLHVDWQRILFPTLLEQGMNNQFIIATHSPFIYSKYPEKELKVTFDRGYTE